MLINIFPFIFSNIFLIFPFGEEASSLLGFLEWLASCRGLVRFFVLQPLFLFVF